MTFPFRRRIIDLCAHDTGLQTGCCCASLETIDQLREQIRQDRQAMSDEIQRLRRQFSIDLEMVSRSLRETRLELDRMRQIDKFSREEHRDLSQSLH
jgi:hypothetical protein